MIEAKEEVSTLSYLGYVLEESGYETRWLDEKYNKDHPYEQLFVVDKNTSPTHTLRLVFAEDVMGAIHQAAGTPSWPLTYSHTLQATLWFPNLKEVPDAKMQECHLLLNHLNQYLTFGLFNHTPTDSLHLRHSFLSHPENTDPRLVAEIVSSLALMAKKYEPALKEWLDGKVLNLVLEGLK